jgi:hypothetical protein
VHPKAAKLAARFVNQFVNWCRHTVAERALILTICQHLGTAAAKVGDHASSSPMRQYSVLAMTLRDPPHIGQSPPSGAIASILQWRRFLSLGIASCPCIHRGSEHQPHCW